MINILGVFQQEMAFFFLNQCYDSNFSKASCILTKNANFSAQNWRKSQKIVTIA
jgi:hypothetical protein